MRNSGDQIRTVLIADDDDAFIDLMRTLLENVGYRTLTARAGDEALRIARESRPPVVLLDIDLPLVNGYEVCRALRAELGRAVAVAFVSGTKTDSLDHSSGLLVGADDYIVKSVDPSEVVARVGALMRRVGGTPASAAPQLTNREREILNLLAQGLDQHEIAHDLSISPKTVATHIEHILEKLGVHSRAQAVAAAYRHQLIDAAQ